MKKNNEESKLKELTMDELVGVNGGDDTPLVVIPEVELPNLEIKGPENKGNGVVDLGSRNDPNGFKLFVNTAKETFNGVLTVLEILWDWDSEGDF
jgi:hypothetical protein